MRHEHVSCDFVVRWTQSPDQDMTEDHRGWPKGKRRVWTLQTEQRIKTLHTTLSDETQNFFTGPTAIEDAWRTAYTKPPPPLRTIGRIMKSLNLSQTRKRG